MNKRQLKEIRQWFHGYVETFHTHDGCLPAALELKLHHSTRVASESRGISEALKWTHDERNSSEALGLLHDVGRFSQHAEFKTFSDAASVDHGERGWLVTTQSAILAPLATEERQAILEGIRYHNRRRIPEKMSSASLPYIKLIRDADKLDIFHIVLESVKHDGFQDLPKMLPFINLDPAPTPMIIQEIRGGQSCSMEHVRTLGDFLLMQASWIYDLNYPATMQRLIDRDILAKLLSHVKGDHSISDLSHHLQKEARSRINS